MPENLTLRVLTPKGVFLDQEVPTVVLPGAEGQFQVLAGHAPMFLMLGLGIMEVPNAEKVAIFGGVAEVRPKEVLVLASNAETSDQVDRERAEQARRRALEHMSPKEQDTDIDFRIRDLSYDIERVFDNYIDVHLGVQFT